MSLRRYPYRGMGRVIADLSNEREGRLLGELKLRKLEGRRC